MGGAACRSQQVMLLRIIITVSNAVEHEAVFLLQTERLVN
jgi:hypothetical protein